MQIEWLSQNGKQRIFNNDAVAFSYSGNFLVVIIVDAAEKILNEQLIYGYDTQGKRLARYWAESCLTAIINNSLPIEENNIVEILAEQHKKLKFNYLHDIACYGILIMNTKINSAEWYYVGDCLIGKETKDNKVHWLHKPHRVSMLPELTLELPGKNLLTKSLNAKRFVYKVTTPSTRINGWVGSTYG